MRRCKSHISKASFLPGLSFLLPATHRPCRYHFKALSISPGISHGSSLLFSLEGMYPLVSWPFPGLGEGAGTQISLSLIWLALTLYLPWILASLGHPTQVCLLLNPCQPHPGFRWRHRPGSGLSFPLWASGPQLSLVSDFISSHRGQFKEPILNLRLAQARHIC